MNKRTSGFTLVELLIVIVVIAILAAISVVAYNGIQNRSRAAATESDRKSITKGIEIYRITNDKYVPTDADDLNSVGLGGMADKIDITDSYPSPGNTSTPKGKFFVRTNNYTLQPNVCNGGACGGILHHLTMYWYDYEQDSWMEYIEAGNSKADGLVTWGPRIVKYYGESNDWMGEPCNFDTLEQCYQ